MFRMKNGIIRDEKGLFVFGPWRFVIIVIVIGFIYSASQKNKSSVKIKNRQNFNDYIPK